MSELYSAEQIAAMVQRLANDLTTILPQVVKDNGNVTFIPVMNGAFRFSSDLLGTLPSSWVPRVDFLTCKSYRGSASIGSVTVSTPPTSNLQGRDVVLIEDIVDRGTTAIEIARMLRVRDPRTLSIVALMRRNIPQWKLILDYYDRAFGGFTLNSNDFVVGYGLDYDGLYRHLNYITTVDEVRRQKIGPEGVSNA